MYCYLTKINFSICNDTNIIALYVLYNYDIVEINGNINLIMKMFNFITLFALIMIFHAHVLQFMFTLPVRTPLFPSDFNSIDDPPGRISSHLTSLIKYNTPYCCLITVPFHPSPHLF